MLPVLIGGILSSCSNQQDNSKKNRLAQMGGTKPRYMHKPPSHFQDTVWVSGTSAVFFYPDSFQLKIVRTNLDTMVYKSIMHDYVYQMRYCLGFLQSEWPEMQIKEARNCRMLAFRNDGQANQYVDLDARPDLYGVFVSSGSQQAIQLEMTNARTQVSFYLSHVKGQGK